MQEKGKGVNSKKNKEGNELMQKIWKDVAIK